MSEVQTLRDAPLVSIVVPTTGNFANFRRCIGSLLNHSPTTLLVRCELIVFFNADPTSASNTALLEQFLAQNRARFHSVNLIPSSQFHLSAEESAYAATAFASGEFLWLVGDKRIFLPEGLVVVNQFLSSPNTVCAYFNSVWIGEAGTNAGMPSTHQCASKCELTFKEFVSRSGINFIATSMGAWIFDRKFLDRERWREVITTCGPHFSHVTTLLATMGDEKVSSHAVYLFLLESKAYHGGNDSEWASYARLSGKYRYYPWTLGMVRQFNLLVRSEKYTYKDVRRSICSEANLVKRQVDDIYVHTLAQLRLGWVVPAQRFMTTEFDEIKHFLANCCPERAPCNQLLSDLFDGLDAYSEREFGHKAEVATKMIDAEHPQRGLLSLVVGQLGNKVVRLHPAGYLVSSVNDDRQFVTAYAYVDPPATSLHWRLYKDEEMASASLTFTPLDWNSLFPGRPYGQARSNQWFKRWTSRLVVALYRRRVTVKLVTMLPGRLKGVLKRILM